MALLAKSTAEGLVYEGPAFTGKEPGMPRLSLVGLHGEPRDWRVALT